MSEAMKRTYCCAWLTALGGLILGLVALFSVGWMTVCIDTDEMLQVLIDYHEDIGLSFGATHFLYKAYHGTRSCFTLGLFNAELTFGEQTLQIPMRAIRTVNLSSAGMLAVGLGFLAIGLFFLIQSFRAEAKITSLRAYNELKIQTFFLLLGGFFVGGCAILYTVYLSRYVSNPERYFSAFGTEVISTLTDQSNSALANQTWIVLEKTNPQFGYSFYLIWVSIGLIIISCILAFVIISKMKIFGGLSYGLLSDT